MRKLLVIGKEGRLAKNAPDPEVLKKYDITYLPLGASDAEIIEKGGDAEYVIVDAMGSISRNAIFNMPKLRAIHSEGVGFQGVDIKAAAEKDIYVCNCKGMNSAAVAEQAVLLMLGLLRDVAGGDRAVRDGEQINVKENYMLAGSLKELNECTIGLVGFGDIAKATAKLVSAFGGKIIYYDIFHAPASVEKELSAEYKPLDELLSASDIVSLHLPVLESTRHIADAAFFKKMKNSAYLINTARGELVDSRALTDAIGNGEISGAGLDTIEGEPVRRDNGIFRASDDVLKKILFSCHIGGVTGASFARGYGIIFKNFEKIAADERPDNIVNGL